MQVLPQFLEEAPQGLYAPNEKLYTPFTRAPPKLAGKPCLLHRLGVELNDVSLQLIVACRHLEAHRVTGSHISHDSHGGLDVNQVCRLGQRQEVGELWVVLLGA